MKEQQYFRIVNNIAFKFVRKENMIVLQVVDLNNLKYKANFKVVPNDLELISSSFAEGKRKYEMLYILERNKKSLLEGAKNA